MIEKLNDMLVEQNDTEHLEVDRKIREIQRKSLSKHPRTSLETFLEKLQ